MIHVGQGVLSGIRGVIFDMDGLMFDTERLYIRLWEEAARQMNASIPRELLLQMIGRNLHDCEEMFVERMGDSMNYQEGRRRLHDLRDSYYRENGVPVKKGLRELLPFLKEKGIRIALATSTNREQARMLLRMAEVESFFDRTVFGDEVAHGKPAPDIFLKAAHDLGLEAEECAVLEDSLAGIRAAYTAGCRAVMVPDLVLPTSETEAMLTAKCDSLLDVPALF